jgi:hypothetical protein
MNLTDDKRRIIEELAKAVNDAGRLAQAGADYWRVAVAGDDEDDEGVLGSGIRLARKSRSDLIVERLGVAIERAAPENHVVDHRQPPTFNFTHGVFQTGMAELFVYRLAIAEEAADGVFRSIVDGHGPVVTNDDTWSRS